MEIHKEALAKTCASLKSKGFDYLTKITAVDYNDYLQLVYILYNFDTKQQEFIKVRLEAKDLTIDTIEKIYKSADWYERELSEMFGIKIKGRMANRLLLEGWNGTNYPLRKSFVWGMDYSKE